MEVREKLKFNQLLKLIRIRLLSCAFFLLLAGCNLFFSSTDNSQYGTAGASQSATIQPGNFDFNTAGDYTYDTNYISVTAGRATLLTVDQTFNQASDFSSGAHSGTAYSSGSLSIANDGSCDGTSVNCLEINTNWIPKPTNLVAHWGMNNNWNDSTGNFNGTVINTPTFTASELIGSHSGTFNYSDNDCIDVGTTNLIDDGTFTIQAWIKLPAAPIVADHNFVQFSGTDATRFQVDYAGSDNLRAFGAIGINFPSALVTNTWYHIALVGDGVNFTAYINGDFEGSIAMAGLPYTTSTTYIGCTNGTAGTWEGNLDEIAFWDTNLTADEISFIYNVQKIRYAGQYVSPIIDLGASGSWTNLSWTTDLPFGKELPGNSGNELSTDYASLVDSTGASGDSDLNNGLIALYHFNETAANSAPVGADFEDFSSNSNHCNQQGGGTFNELGVLGTSTLHDDTSNQYLDCGSDASLDNLAALSWSFWLNTTKNSSTYRLVTKHTTHKRLQLDTSNRLFMYINHTTTALQVRTDALFTPFEWNHVVVTWDGGIAASGLKIYINGKEATYDTQIDAVGTASDDSAGSLRIGGNTFYTPGYFDEFAMWGRELHASEVLELYRRGANRVKYQVRSCNDAACSGETWIGPDGSANTYFSELENCTSINGATGVCNGAVQIASPGLTFSDFVTPPAANRYFQYRAILESDDENSLCAGSTTCVPSVSSIEVGPTGRYYGGSPTIVNNTPVAFTTLTSLTATEGGTCTPTYQVSNDGATFYYHNGANWVAGSTSAQANNATVMNANLSSFVSDVAAGNLYFRAYLNSDTSQTCEIDNLLFGL